ncbi:UDP-N-acetylmuramate dehydrogenase [Gluconobacter sphaericus]|uniref:UDP-N-acetylenolpyruvoylglucosamine reductase n=1 Tax=Gluconobacter sphaericus NBRC 12467 TaxID=1307951 RepID=A0AA37SKN3_9PROT|nr:UDP-N-acetylmuramate dehydrogenase [Gluconobacter sphaericus]MBF0886312.1 UDP-N-acetylmuramate dehydrogenase [Gluconobacter sphaericus]MBS1086344.1 UDP-N-acetylmuramate dehydrogenase [Gluconobacter sphaericus]MBS1100342.1 UDP-N-acetylmuramate dehydrogenase [Gluconobacter sphaericus]QQX91254.1 UDP-N-acetylmuramate dehydrogenase [Gluconobacter sphaericus]GBR52504.1 UDP-N-acetylenolpyruvoylglucosamine reductase [Gluconobacter sphaericus NBRC 12467]
MTGSNDFLVTGLRGRLTPNAPLGPRAWFRVGGPADWLFVPEDQDDLTLFLREKPATMPVTVLGACSNVIIRDGGITGTVIRLARGFADISVQDNSLIVGAAALDITVAEHAASAGLAGLEFLAGIPGSIGGAVRMNAGAYGSDINAILEWAEILTAEGEFRRLSHDDLGFAYRHSELPEGSVVIRASLRGTPDNADAIRSRIADIRASREASQPVRARTGGSTFRNPEGHKAWQLIDEAGCRGLQIGDAQVSEKHCNFLLNLGQASSVDLEALGETVREKVLAQSGVDLHWEIKRIGRKSEGEQTV